MSDHYTEADKARTAPIRDKVLNYMLDTGWHDLDNVAKALVT